MISYFKANDPYRLIGVLIILLLIRGIIFLVGSPLLIMEVKWMLIGERLGNGFAMYRDLWDFTAPLSAGVYKWLYIFFGRSRVPYFVISILLVIYQAGIFNHMLLSNKAYGQNTYIPAFMYVICMNLFLDFLTLSPVLMGMTFVLLGLNNLFKRMDHTTRDELFVYTGIHLGIATLFFLPYFLGLIITLMALVLYTGSIIRRVLLLIYGYITVIFGLAIFYYWRDGLAEYGSFFFASLWSISQYNFMEYSDIFVAMIIPLFLLIFSVVRIVQFGRYINFQIRIQYVMFFFVIAGILGLLLVKELSTYQLIYFVPFIAFFLSHYLLTIKHWIFAEASAAFFIILLMLNHAATRDGWLIYEKLVDYSGLYVQESIDQKVTEGKSLLCLKDNHLSDYKLASLATPYLDWQLSEELLSNQNYFDNNIRLYNSLKDDLPEVIIDEKNVIKEIFFRLPDIEARYSEDPYRKGVYHLKP